MEITYRWILGGMLIILLILSAIFSASETSLTSLTKLKIKSLTNISEKKIEKLTFLLDKQSKLLTTVLVCNNIVNIAMSSISTYLLVDIFGGAGVVFATFLITVMILIFGEIMPKSIATNNPEKVALYLVNTVMFFMSLMSPIVWIFDFIKKVLFFIFRIKEKTNEVTLTESELKTLVQVSEEEGIIEKEESEYINNVFNFRDKKVKECMINKFNMIAIDSKMTYSEIINHFKVEQFTRMPVFKDSLDEIIGTINIKDIIFISDKDKENFNILDYIREAHFTYEYKNVSDLFEELKLTKTQISVVVDEYGATAGLITLEDLLEEIVGDINDEFDIDEKSIIKISDTEYIVHGYSNLTEVNEELNINLYSKDFDSIGGYLLEHNEGFLSDGDEIKIDNIIFIIEKADKTKIDKVKIIKEIYDDSEIAITNN